MTYPAFIYDVDGCLLDFVSGFAEYMRDVEGVEINHPDEVGHYSWSMRELFPGLAGDEILDAIPRFAKNGRYSRLLPVPGARYATKVLRDRFPDVRTAVITACGLHPDTIVARLHNLAIYGFPIDEFNATPVVGRKDAWLKLYEPGSVVIEDNAHNAAAAAALGFHSVLIDRPYNRNEAATGFVRVPDWVGVVEHILDHAERKVA